MPPKRTRNQGAPSSSQPEPQKAMRASTRKRRASDASSVSERPGSSQSQSQPATGLAGPAKRRKTRKGKAAVSEEPEVIVEEQEEEVLVNDAAPANTVTREVVEETVERDGEGEVDVEEEAIDVSKPRTRHVHFGSDDAGDKSTATHKTPHNTKMAIKRRATVSPNLGGNADASKRYKTITHRTSLPASLSQAGTESTQTIQEHQFVALRDMLDDRIRRRLRRNRLSEEQNTLDDQDRRDSRTLKELEELRQETADKEARIRQLMLDLESQRQFGIDVSEETHAEQERIRAVEAELAALREEVLANRSRGHMDDSPDEEMMVIDSQQEAVSYPQIGEDQTLPVTPSAKGKQTLTRLSQHELAVPENRLSLTTPGGSRQWEAERRRFEDTILTLSNEANEATTKLQILTIELQSLGFTQEEVSNTEVIQSIRESFDSIRERLDLVLPGSLPEDASNMEILDILFANVQEFAERLRNQDREAQEQTALNTDLRVQVDKLIDHLAAAEIRIRNLEQQWRELDETSEDKEREIDELEQAMGAAEDERDGLREELEKTQREAAELGTENKELTKSVEKLTVSLQGYRNEETRLTALITKMEEDHSILVANMNTEREETVGDLENRLFTESTERGEAQKQAEDKQIIISELEVHIGEISAVRDGLIVELETAKTALVAEKEARDLAESEAADKDVQVDHLETRVNNLESELDSLNTQLEEFRNLNDGERRQREAAETELDDRNTEIEGLNQRLREQGMEANNLRQKMFEVQQQNLTKVTELQQAASDQDAQYQRDIADEVDRRENAEETARGRDATILELQASLEDIETRMRDVLADRDTRIAALEETVAFQTTEITALQTTLAETRTTLETETVASELRRTELEALVAALQDTIAEREDSIRDLQRAASEASALHASETDDRNTAIAMLNHNIATLHSSITDLESVKAGLERRVEAEAEQMLQLSGEKADEIESLKATIRDKQTKILVVEEKAVEADQRWQEVLDARDEEIKSLRTRGEETSQTVETLSVQRDGLKKRFQAYIHRTNAVVKNLQEELARAKAAVDAKGEGFRGEGEGLLEELEQMDEVSEMVAFSKTTQSQSSSAQAGASSSQGQSQVKGRKSAAGGKGRKKRVYDSGFGVASDGDETLTAL